MNKHSLTQADSLAEALRQRWTTPLGQEKAEQIRALIEQGASVDAWLPLLKGIPLMENLSPSDEEPFPRDLRGFNFHGANLRKADLSRTHLDFATFESAVVEDARFRGASLQGAKFKRAAMRKAHFWNAWLEEANLAYADLTEADLGDANLRGLSPSL